MNPTSPSDIERDEKINVVVFEFESAVDRGEKPDPAEWVAKHPDLAPELAEYFEGLATLGLGKSRNEQSTRDYPADPAVAPSTSPPLSRLGDYLLLERLGRGGEGTVYRAKHRVNDHEVALKMVTSATANDLGADLRLRDEARAIAGLRHPHIVRIHFSGEDQGIWYYTMELMEGGGLEDQIDQYKKNPKEAAELVRKIAQGIHHAHTRGILHLDLKPANVLLDLDGIPHVSDFGLAVRIQARAEASHGSSTFSITNSAELPTNPGPGVLNMTRPQIRGTAPYMSPEMAAGRLAAVTTSADIYGLGAILYTLITGRPPIVGRSMSDTLFRVIHERPIPPRSLNKRVERELQAVCLKCLRKDPAKRYGSADALANDLGRFLRGEPTLAGEPNAPRRVWFWLKRNPWGTAAAALTILVLWLAGVVGSLGELRDANRREAERVAREASIQIKMIERAVRDLAEEPALSEAFNSGKDGSPLQRKELSDVLARATEKCNRWFDFAGGNPVLNFFILNNKEAVRLADSINTSRSVYMNFPLRDYFKHFENRPEANDDRDEVYVSRSFRSTSDGYYKIAAASRIWEGTLRVGLIVATLTIGNSLLLLKMADQNPGVLISAPFDSSYPHLFKEGNSMSKLPKYIAVLHRNYHDARRDAITLALADYPRLADFERNKALQEAAELSKAGSVLHYRRVGNTHLVVVAERPYPWQLRLFLDVKWRPWTCLAIFFFVVTPIGLWLRRRKSRETIAAIPNPSLLLKTE